MGAAKDNEMKMFEIITLMMKWIMIAPFYTSYIKADVENVCIIIIIRRRKVYWAKIIILSRYTEQDDIM